MGMNIGRVQGCDRQIYSGDFLGVTDFAVWPVGNNRKIDHALFSGSEQKIINRTTPIIYKN
jgi:hypothetical protein